MEVIGGVPGAWQRVQVRIIDSVFTQIHPLNGAAVNRVK